MKSFQGRQKTRRLIYSKLSLLLLILLVGGLLKGTWGMYKKASLAKDNLQASAERLSEFQTRKFELQNKVEKIKTARGVEEEIRRNFPVVKEGEKVITVVDQTGSSSVEEEPKKEWWKKIIGR